MNSYETLGNAVVLQAARDWRDACRALRKHPKNHEARAMKAETERFFQSQYFNVFTSLDGEALLERLKKEEGV